jgi:Tol biopolymer transport system component
MRQPVETQLRNYFEQIEETHGPLSTNAILDRTAPVQVIPESRPVTPPSRAIRKWAWAIALIVFVGVAILLGAIDSDTPPVVDQPVTTTIPGTIPTANGWIAFSTQPGLVQVGDTDYDVGGDIYLVRQGEEPTLIVSRGDANTTNVCPMFSPDGSKLVYGTGTDSSRDLVFLAVATDGTVDEMMRMEVPRRVAAPCPAWWSSDGMRFGFIQRSSKSYAEPDGAMLVFRGLDGSTPEVVAGDPTIDELKGDRLNGLEGPLLSPDGQLIVVRGTDGQLTVSNADGSDRRVIAGSGYSVPAWSPDGRKVLTMTDVGGGFGMVAHSIDEPFASVVLVSSLPVNGERSWPGRGDVSWQPIYPGS